MTENQKDKLKNHEFDGIKEYDNKLPMWWLWTFMATIAFAVIYWSYYHITEKGPDQAAEFQMDKNELLAAQKAESTEFTDEVLQQMLKDPERAAAGAKTYASNCAACHGPEAKGLIGPNLTDGEWIHGGSPQEIYNIIQSGVPAKGMPTWQGILNDGQMHDLVAFIKTLNKS